MNVTRTVCCCEITDDWCCRFSFSSINEKKETFGTNVVEHRELIYFYFLLIVLLFSKRAFTHGRTSHDYIPILMWHVLSAQFRMMPNLSPSFSFDYFFAFLFTNELKLIENSSDGIVRVCREINDFAELLIFYPCVKIWSILQNCLYSQNSPYHHTRAKNSESSILIISRSHARNFCAADINSPVIVISRD